MKYQGRLHRAWFWWTDYHWFTADWSPLKYGWPEWLTRLIFCASGRRCEAIQDHCGKPEHDLCWKCNRSMPGQAERLDSQPLSTIESTGETGA